MITYRNWLALAIVAPLLSLTPSSPGLQAGIWDSLKSTFIKPEQPQPPTIRVLVAHNIDAVVIEVKGKYNLYDPHTNKKIGSYFVGKSNLVQPLRGGLKWGEEFPDTYQFQIVPDATTITTIVDGIEYKGSIYVYDIGGKISIVNELDIEDYVSSILSLAIERPLAEEALSAAAITARTQAYHVAMSAANPYWHVEAKKVGYQGNAVTSRHKEIDQAIASTRYMVMSKTGTYDKTVTPVPANFVATGKAKNSLSLAEAEAQAQKGENAAKILARAFPNTTIELTHAQVETPQEIAEAVHSR